VNPVEELALLEALGEAGAGGSTLLEQVQALVADRDQLAAQLKERQRATDRDGLLASLDLRREDTLLLLSDACLDLADDLEQVNDVQTADLLRKEAKGWGWLGLRRKWPTWNRSGWRWFRVVSDPGEDDSDELETPRELRTGDHRFPSARAALEWVVGLIASGEWKPE